MFYLAELKDSCAHIPVSFGPTTQVNEYIYVYKVSVQTTILTYNYDITRPKL